jgi:DnaK suppressor protein
MDAARARDLLERERTRLNELSDDGDDQGFGYSDDSAGGGLNDGMGGDAATQIHDLEVNQSIRGHVEAELAEVDAALERVDAGTYGTCEVCGDEISDERLEARPTTRFCAADAERGERMRGVEDRGTGGLSGDVERQRRGPS